MMTAWIAQALQVRGPALRHPGQGCYQSACAAQHDPRKAVPGYRRLRICCPAAHPALLARPVSGVLRMAAGTPFLRVGRRQPHQILGLGRSWPHRRPSRPTCARWRSHSSIEPKTVFEPSPVRCAILVQMWAPWSARNCLLQKRLSKAGPSVRRCGCGPNRW